MNNQKKLKEKSIYQKIERMRSKLHASEKNNPHLSNSQEINEETLSLSQELDDIIVFYMKTVK